jgi:histidyl-tRNA synthetase
VYKSYGFEHWDTPVIEYADTLGKYMPGEGEVAEGVYSFRNPEKEPVYDENGNELRDTWDKALLENHFVALRYDLTAPLARLYAEQLWTDKLKNLLNADKMPLFRRFQFGPVFRFEAKLDPGRFREFWQLDFDSVGTSDVTADAEACMILSDAMEAIGIKRGNYIVKVNNRKILKGFLQGLGVEEEEKEQSILRIVDKLDKIGLEGIKAELGNGRKDVSGAEIKGLELDQSLVDKITTFFLLHNLLDEDIDTYLPRPQALKALQDTKLSYNSLYNQGIEELEKIDIVLSKMGYDEDRIIFDPSLVRGMSYYTGPVFEVISKQTYTDEKGNERKVGSICGGGRYDGLVEKLLGVKVPATGASIGVDRLAELLMLTKQSPKQATGPVFIVVFDPNLMPEYQKIASELRKAKIDTEVYYGMERGLKRQLAYADRKGCPVAIMLGENELQKGAVTVKDLKAGKDVAENFADKAEWLKTIQFEVKREELVLKVKELIEKYK